MSIFAKATNTQAFLKCGIMGFAGSGKTFTATQIAIGLVQIMREKELEQGDKPVMFLDTETGSDWVEPEFRGHNIELFTAKTRSFADLIPAVREAEKTGGLLIIDSISHFWRELTESYAEIRKRRHGLQFQDWAYLKQRWGEFTDTFVNSNCHIIMCGRAGYEYDFFENESGKKELEKTGVKMKAETETGYEPSILILMERHMEMESKKAYRTGTVLKDRSQLLDGKIFKDPSFVDFKPHIDFLNLGGHQLGVDTTRNSKSSIPYDGKSDWQRDKEEKEVVLDEIQSVMVKHYPSTTAHDKQSKGDLLEKFFQSRAWKRVETYPLSRLKSSYNELHLELEGVPAYGDAPSDDIDDDVFQEEATDTAA